MKTESENPKQRPRRIICCAGGLLAAVLVLFPVAGVRAGQLDLDELMELSLGDLMDVEVTSLAMKSQVVAETPAAVFVVSEEDISRSGATSVPELLRMVPGFQVARVNSHKWAITSRGFNGALATKLLVMVDGRDVYSPLSSGVFWDEHDMMLGDVERIEVVRGPGGSLWGANAVNGVINIISKDASKTQGTRVSILTGSEEDSWAVRYGDAFAENVHFRIYFKGYDRDGAVDASGHDTADDWSNLRGGFRMDADHAANHFTLQGDASTGEVGETLSLPLLGAPYSEVEDVDSELHALNVLGRWIHQYAGGSTMQLQSYYDHAARDNGRLSTEWDTVDIDLSQNLLLSENNEFTWGLDYRMIHGEFSTNFFFSFKEPEETHHTYGAFVQDEHAFFDDKVTLTAGSKFMLTKDEEFEYQPSARIFYAPLHQHGFWASVARAVRTPDHIETGTLHHPTAFPMGPPPAPPTGVLEIRGNPDLDSEEVLAYEAGYRYHMENDFRVDLALFFNEYDNLRSFESGGPPVPAAGYTAIPIHIENRMEGISYGAEIAVDWRIARWWEIEAAYSFLEMDLEVDADSTDTRSEAAEDEVPEHTVTLRSHFALRDDLDLDLWGRFADGITVAGATSIDPAFALDMQLAWRPTEELEISLVGQNLLDSQAPQWGEDRDNHFISEVERSVYLKMEVEF